ncbi:MAG: Asp-tRNA(Asn)/Glu-tRNA(Gln) amidotransferase subunit GatA [Treponemataceae bacterium]
MPLSVFPDGFDTYFRAWEAKIGAFLEFSPDPPVCPLDPSISVDEKAAAAVSGLPFAVKDNIAVEGFGLTCGSKLLAKMRAPYSATAVQRLTCAGAIVVGKTNMDEFGMGSSTDNSALKQTNNPWDLSRVPGGSSGGSAAAVAAGVVPFALGTDTGGSVRQPASFCGVVGLKPTYGAVSRFGLVAYASSLETIGVLSDTVSRARSVFAVMRGKDTLDQTSIQFPADLMVGRGKSDPKTIGVLTPDSLVEALTAGTGSGDGEKLALLENEVAAGFRAARERLTALGHTLVEVRLPSLKYTVPTYYTIATAEASANLARFDGIRYGARPAYAENPEDLIDKTRGAGFGSEVKLRILLGTFVLRSGFQDQYYNRAQKIRTGIRRDFDRVLCGVDAILMPVFPTRAFGRGEEGLSPFAQKAADVFTCCANLAGLPALAFPATVENGLPVGVQLVGRAFAESVLFDIAQGYEEAHPIARPAGYQAFWG